MPELKIKNQLGEWVDVGGVGPRPTPEAVASAVDANPTIAELTPDRAQVVTGDGAGGRQHVRIAKTPEMYGAVGDYNPDTDTGTDDTVALQLWLDDLAPGEEGVFPPNKLFLATDTLITSRYPELRGHGRGSGLFFKNANPANDGLWLGNVGANQSTRTASLKNFGIYGSATPGAAAIRAYYMTNAEIDLWLHGGWVDGLRVWTDVPFGTLTGGGGIEKSYIRINTQHDNPIPGFTNWPVRLNNVVTVRGWANATTFDLNIRVCEGHALYLEGNYTAANGGLTVKGSFEGVSHTDVDTPIHIIRGNKVVLDNIYCEQNGHPQGSPVPTGYHDIVLENVHLGSLRDTMGRVKMVACSDVISTHPSHLVTIDADCVACVVDGPAGETDLLVANASPSTIYRGWPRNTNVTSLRGPSGPGEQSETVFLNGDMERWVGGTATQLWGARPPGAPSGTASYFVAEKCGDGLTDTTRTANARYSAKIEPRPSYGATLHFPVFTATQLAGMLGDVVWVSFKIKEIAGTVYLRGTHATRPTGGDTLLTDLGRPCENGFRHIVYAYKVDASMVAEGFDLRFYFSGSSFYLSEVMAGIGTVAPRGFHSATYTPGYAGVRLENGRLVVQGTAAPVSGGDPVTGQAWQVGDRIENTAPAASGYLGWVCTAAGSPGTWKGYGAIEP